jgi:putative hydrolase of the HAD superfamily
MAIKGLIFDLGNTLMYFAGDWPEVFMVADKAMVKYLVQTGCDLDQDRFALEFRDQLREYYVAREQEHVELTTAHILKNLLTEHGYPSVPDQVVERALESFYQETQAYWLPEQDASATLAALKSQDYHLGVISNASDDADVQNLVDKAEVRPYLDFVLSSASCGIRKPNPEIFNIALKRWGFSPQEVAMVGDTLDADVLGGKNAGLYTIWITRRVGVSPNPAKLDHIQPDATIQTLAELPALLADIP